MHAEVFPSKSARSLTSVAASVGPVHAEVPPGASATSNIVTDSLGRVHLKELGCYVAQVAKHTVKT